MERSEKYWISPEGEVITVNITHVQTVIDDPGRFGWDMEGIRVCYTKHRERLGLEGKARAEILVENTRRGWVRVRHHSRCDVWDFQIWDPSDEGIRNRITRFIASAVAERVMNLYADIRLLVDRGSDPAEKNIIYGVQGGAVTEKWVELTDRLSAGLMS